MNYPRLTSLPPEILIQILIYVNPFDILAFRKTSKLTAEITSDKGLWAALLDTKICRELDILPANYDAGSLSLKQLEKAVIRPSLIRRNLLCSEPSSARPSATQDPAVKVLIPHAQDLAVIDGGRFVLVTTVRSLECWDFGDQDSPFASTPPRCMATVALNGVYVFGLQALCNWMPDVQRSAVSLVCVTHPDNQPAEIICMYTIDLKSTNPSFVLQDQMQGHEGPGFGIRHLDVSDGWVLYTSYSGRTNRLMDMAGTTQKIFDLDIDDSQEEEGLFLMGIWMWHSKLVAWFDNTNNFSGKCVLAIYDPMTIQTPRPEEIPLDSAPPILSPIFTIEHVLTEDRRGRFIRIADDIFALCARDDQLDDRGGEENQETLYIYRALRPPKDDRYGLELISTQILPEPPFFGLWSPGYFFAAQFMTVAVHAAGDETWLRAMELDPSSGALKIGHRKRPWKTLPESVHVRAGDENEAEQSQEDANWRSLCADEFCIVSGRLFRLGDMMTSHGSVGPRELRMLKYPLT